MSNRLTALEVCGESSEQYTPMWVSREPKLVSLDIEGNEEDLRVIHNLNVLGELSKKNGGFLKDFEVYREAFRFTPSSALVKNDTGETIYVTGTENDRVRFLLYARPEGEQLEVPFFNPNEEDLSNIERSLLPTEIDRIDMVLRETYSFYGDYLSDPYYYTTQEFTEINSSLRIWRKKGRSGDSGPKAYQITPLVRWWFDSELRNLQLVEEKNSILTCGVGYSPEKRFLGTKGGYSKVIEEIGERTQGEGGLVPSNFFLKVDEYRKTGQGVTTLRISL